MPVKIDYCRCIGCRKCYDLCPMDVFAWDEEINMPKVAYEKECWHACGICVMNCPKRAIELTMPLQNW